MNLPLKPGHTTTEFWLVIATGLLGTGLSAMSLLNVSWAFAAIAALTFGYNYGRARLKAAQASTPPPAPTLQDVIAAIEAAKASKDGP